MKHIKLFEDSFQGIHRGIAEMELEMGIGLVIYDIEDYKKLLEMFEQFYPNGEMTYEEFKKEMSTPGIYGVEEVGGPWEIIPIAGLGDFLNAGRFFGMLYRF
jgi:hypothetical protein